jgi:chromosome segregation ATPase
MRTDVLLQKEGLGKALPEAKDDDTTIIGKRKSRDTIRELRTEIASLKGTITELVEKAKADQMCIDENNAEMERLNSLYEHADACVAVWQTRYEEAMEELKKAQHERDLLKEMMQEKPSMRKFKVRQIAIIALALCRKALVVPKNKKSIAKLFSKMTGSSHNTISQNLCDTYTDEEIQVIAEPLKESMPELAEYMLENKFAG